MTPTIHWRSKLTKTMTNTHTNTHIHKYTHTQIHTYTNTQIRSAWKTHHVLYFLKAWGSRISNNTFPCDSKIQFHVYLIKVVISRTCLEPLPRLGLVINKWEICNTSTTLDKIFIVYLWFYTLAGMGWYIGRNLLAISDQSWLSPLAKHTFCLESLACLQA